MTDGTIDLKWLHGEVRAAGHAFADQLRSLDNPNTKVPNLDWTVAELAAHLVSLGSLYIKQNEIGDRFVPPADWAEFSIEARAHIDETDLNKLADLLEHEIETLIDNFGPDAKAPLTLYGCATTVGNTLGGILGELILHGMDLSALTGVSVPFTRDQANAVIPSMMALLPAFVDPVKAQKCPGTFAVKFRGGAEYTQRVADGKATVERGLPTKPDARINADPVAFVLVGLGRMSQFRAPLTGKIIGYGRKPWLLYHLGNVAVDGV